MTTRSLPASHPVQAIAARRAGWFDWLSRVLRAVESRRHLSEMDGRMLADIGISRAEAREEAARAPWDLAPPRR
ncbi:DUF1127 domain-containing protein [Roseomonas eburnea]|uniref:DUF1127 domain-containing protein n=1 Tax=Neoroseomonas eburnea TaxID=1346889 RepID=A0A9X9XGL3_9PROT|nr:DUF1127 domain-containing protein [Neoroseomonas eburnea]MBR0682849.1 DUF1127 domain-containing protein [Neoroseomonas eburnea]